ncbi:MAG TPA: M12 family metallo-peptidase [Galbitalea sp.]|nr:M12 family metallo-peptidase [Galbitalea sp.]
MSARQPTRSAARALSSSLLVATGAIAMVLGLTFTGSAPQVGVAIANASTPGSTSTGAASSPGAAIQTGAISGTEKVYVSVVETTPQTSDDVNTGMTQAAVQTMIARLNSYWSAQSNGAVTVQLGGFETRSLGESTCSPNAALGSEESAAFGGMFANEDWRGTHNHLMVLSTESCSAESFATVGGSGGEVFSGNGISASEGVEYLLHEFGHNLGFEHADASICTNTGSYDGLAANLSFTSTVCPTREYDDYFDIMGYTVKNATPNLSSPQRIMAGWLTNYATLDGSTASARVTLTALSGSGGIQALKITDPLSGDDYYVEYRTDTGLDATSAEFNYGLQCDPAMSGYTICELDSNKSTGDVRVLRFIPFASQGANGTTVLATGLTAGSTDKTKRHTHLNAGNSFTSIDDGFSFTVVSMSPSVGATIQVSFPNTTQGLQFYTTPAAVTKSPNGTISSTPAADRQTTAPITSEPTPASTDASAATPQGSLWVRAV